MIERWDLRPLRWIPKTTFSHISLKAEDGKKNLIIYRLKVHTWQTNVIWCSLTSIHNFPKNKTTFFKLASKQKLSKI